MKPLQNTTKGKNMEEKGTISGEEYHLLTQNLLEEKRKIDDNIWVEANLIYLDEVIRLHQDKPTKEFTEEILNVLAKIVGAIRGVLFVYLPEQNILKVTAGFACEIETLTKKEFAIGEGLVGQVAKSLGLLCLDEIDVQFDNSLGGMGKAYMVITPLTFSQKIYGVVEVMIANKITPKYVTFLDRAGKNIAIGMQMHFSSIETQKVLTQAHIKINQDTKKWSEEIQQKENLIAELQAKLEKKEEELEQALSHINLQDILPQEAQYTQQQIAKLNEEYQNQLFKKQAEIDMLKDTVRWKDEEIEKLDNEILERKNEAKSNIQRLTDEIKQLKSQLEGQNIAQQNEQLLEAWKERYAIVETDLDQTRQELSALRQLLQEADENFHKTKAELSDLQQKYKKREDEFIVSQYLLSHQEDVTELNRKIEQLNYQIADKDSELEELNEQLIEIKKELEKQTSSTEYIQEIESLKQQNANLNEELKVLREKTLEMERLQSTNMDLNEELEKLKQNLLEIERSKQNLEEKELLIKEFQTQIDSTSQYFGKKIDALHIQLQQKTEALEKLELLLEEKENLIATHSKAEENTKQAFIELQAQFSALQIDIIEKNNQIQELINQIQEKDNAEKVPEIAEIIAELRMKDEELTHLKQQKEANEQAFQKKLEDLEVIHTHLSEKKAEIEAQTRWLHEQTERLLEQTNNMELQNTSLSGVQIEKIKALDNSFVVMELDKDGIILEVNKPFERILGYDKQEVIGKNIDNIIDIADRSQKPYTELRSQIEHKIVVMLNLHYEGKEGELVLLRTFFHPVIDQTNQITKILAISQYSHL